MDAVFLQRVFERFRQAESSTTRVVGGLGLGDDIVCHLVEVHWGTVTPESEGVGHGADFSATFPLLMDRGVSVISRTTRSPVRARSIDDVRVLLEADEA